MDNQTFGIDDELDRLIILYRLNLPALRLRMNNFSLCLVFIDCAKMFGYTGIKALSSVVLNWHFIDLCFGL